MREILFRGKRIDNGELVEGYYVETLRYNNLHWIWDGKEYIAVDSATICQYTGLKDKNGQRIFEGDVIEWFEQGESEHPDFGYIEYDEQSFAWRVCWQRYDPDFMEGMQQEYISVVGNIHDNPELLESL